MPKRTPARTTRARRTPPKKRIHFEYNVDLSNPTEKKLEKIKNDLVKKITKNVGREMKTFEETGPEALNRHDRHYSIHSDDPVASQPM